MGENRLVVASRYAGGKTRAPCAATVVPPLAGTAAATTVWCGVLFTFCCFASTFQLAGNDVTSGRGGGVERCTACVMAVVAVLPAVRGVCILPFW